MGVKGDVTPKHAPPFCVQIWKYLDESLALCLDQRGDMLLHKDKSFISHKKSNGHFPQTSWACWTTFSSQQNVSNWLLGNSDVKCTRWGHSHYEMGAFPLRDGGIPLTSCRTCRLREWERKEKTNYCIQHNLLTFGAYESCPFGLQPHNVQL